ncbi:unnamed protein product [Urochloa decumbens]|uniref:F-box domain-containing protein n=1 Tax=Urochloa decumbens TaxID=240449 RepID=A0ABC9F2Z0_9POAL
MELDAKGKRARASSSILAGDDRLSSLPDALIHQIMSFMKARQVVQTCVLATRWKNLWRSVPCLNIDRDEFNTEGPDRDFGKERQMFEDFTDHLLIPNNVSVALLDTFQLHTSDGYYGGRDIQAARWIRHSIKYSSHQPGIQRKGLSSSSWRLKRLHLSNVNLDESFTKHVTSGCPYLEDLELKGCSCAFHDITSHTLKNLILKNCSGLTAITSSTLTSLVIHIHEYTRSLLVITAPAVAYLLLESRSYEGGVSLEEMPSLAKASIRLLGNGPFRSKLGDDQFKLLDSVSNVTSLYLSDFKAMVPCEEFPEFNNLGTLLLDQCDLSDNFQILAYFLQSAPNLEKLTLRRCKFSKDPMKKEREGQVEQGCPNQLEVRCKNLKHTEIIYKDHDVQKLVELFLSISGSLPKNNIKLTKVDSPHR